MKDAHAQDNETPQIQQVLSAVVNTLDRLELGQIALREEMVETRGQMSGMHQELHEVKVSVSVLGTEIQGEIAQLGSDLRSEIADLRTEVKTDIQSLSETVADAVIGLDERVTVLELRR